MSYFKEFRDFVFRGNIVELAIAVIIGAAFGAVVASLVADIITPLLLSPALKAAGVEDISLLHYNGIKYGKFLAALLNFIVIAMALFSLIKLLNSMKKKQSEVISGPSSTDLLLMEIRDQLRR